MSIFERRFGGPKDVISELKENNTETQATQEPTREKKTVDDVKEALGDLQGLRVKRWDTLQKHRDTTEELRGLGVHETNPDTTPRTETVKDILGPIEDELVAISTEIIETQNEFDLQPNRASVIGNRLLRLGELKSRAEKAFYATPSGTQIKYFDAQISKYYQQSDLYGSEMAEIKEKKAEFFMNDKVAHGFAQTMERIAGLQMQLEDTLTKSKKTGYDINGHKEV